MFLREASTFLILSAPWAYSFWASMMTRTESLVLAVEGGTPASWRNDLASDMVFTVGRR